VEQLGSMTPEELEAIPSIGSGTVEKILVAVNAYYAQFDQGAEAGSETAEIPVEDLPVELAPETVLNDEESAGAPPLEAESAAAGSGSEAAETGPVPRANQPDEKKEFDTIENSEGLR